MLRIGLFGGAFDPVHEMHVKAAVAAVKQLNLDKLIVVPTNISPHKNVTPAPKEDRLNMLRIAFEDVGKAEISDFEIMREGKSFSFITAEHFKDEYKDAEMFMIVGLDMLKDFFTWKNPERILSSCTLAAFLRDGYFADETLEDKFRRVFKKDYVKISFSGENVSSSEIRAYLNFGLTPSGVNEKVLAYIRENGLYPPDGYSLYVKNALPEKRLIHTANVVACALSKAKELDLDAEKVRIAATLHDCAKYDDAEKYKDFTLPKDVPPPVRHAFLGAYVAEHVLGVTDTEILDAIRYHTSGKAGMTKLSQLIFVADMVERGRTYPEVTYLRELFEKDFDECFKRCLEEEVKHLISGKKYIYRETLSAYEYYVADGKI